MPSLVEAIRDKYCSSGAGDADTEESSNNGLIFQFVTFKRNETNFVEGTTQIPPVLVLNNYQIDAVGEEHELNDAFKKTIELDLACNDLSAWDEVHKLFKALPRLKFLNMNYNKLCEPIPKPELFQDKEIPAFSSLSTLILIGTNISWPSVWTLIHSMGQLEELHLSKNNFDLIDTCATEENPSDGCKLKRFIFNDNPLQDWCEVNKLGKCFPCLEHLGLSETLLVSIDPESYTHFPKLQSLYLSSTKINEMGNVTNLQKFPSLTELRIQGADFLSDLSAHERRQLTIALLPNVLKLNGTPISDVERDASERAFIRYFDQLHLEGPKPERYSELTKAHGTPEPLVELDLRPKSKVKLWFIFEDQNKKVLKEVKVQQTCAELKTYTRKLLALGSNRFRLFYQNVACAGREEMRFPQKYLYSYNPDDNDEIVVVPFGSISGPATNASANAILETSERDD